MTMENKELSEKTLFIVDFSWLYNKYYYGVIANASEEILKSDEDLSCKIADYLRGLLENIRYYFHSKCDIYLVLDPPTSNLVNSKLYEGYKAQRPTELKSKVYRFYPRVIKILCNSGFYTILRSQEYEADQVIAQTVINNKNNYKRVIIYSGDKDLIQLTCFKNVDIADSYKHNNLHVLTNKEIFSKFKDYRYTPFNERISENKIDILKYRVLRGDSSDNIPPVVPRLKDRDIRVIIRECWTENKFSTDYLNEILDKLYYIDSDLSDKLRENKDNWIRNYKLMNLFNMGKINMNIEEIHG